ncbi:MAG: family 4 glycosyl hydrolase [Planctomycetota bacterium]|jgi:alpha-galactosidase
MKITVIGAGSYVFTTTVVTDLLDQTDINDGELVLVDLNYEAAQTMAGVAQRMAEDRGVNWKISTETDRLKVLEGSDFVILCACPFGMTRWEKEVEIFSRFGLERELRECGGLKGLTESLCTIRLALDVAGDMEHLCPDAILLDVTNPMPRLITAVTSFTKIKAYGFCSVALRGPEGYSMLAEMTDRTISDIDVVTGGLNHFAWLISIKDKETGEDLLPIVEKKTREGTDTSAKVFTHWLDKYGLIPAGNFQHHNDFLPDDREVPFTVHNPFHGSAEEREKHWQMLNAVAERKESLDFLYKSSSWEHPARLAAALSSKTEMNLPAVNTINNNSMPQLPADRIVEIPVSVENGEVKHITEITFPDKLASLLNNISDIHNLVPKGVAESSKDILYEAIDKDIAIGEKKKAKECLDVVLEEHADIIGEYN